MPAQTSVARSKRTTTLLVLIVFATVAASLLPVHSAQEGDPGADHRWGRPLAPTSGIWIVAVVTDPQTDRGGTESITTTDEAVVLWNAGDQEISIDGWELTMSDGTDAVEELSGTLAPGAWLSIINPAGTMNNDVRLTLRSDDDTAVDDVTLGALGIPDGNAADWRDEVVHLAGSWAGLRAPWSDTWPLGTFWVERIGRDDGNTTTYAVRGEPTWFGAQPGALVMDLHVPPASNAIDAVNLSAELADGSVYRLTVISSPADPINESGPWRIATDQIVPAADADGPFRVLDGSTSLVDSWSDGTPLAIRADPTVPVFDAGDPVADISGRIHWFPPASDAESGIASVRVHLVNATGNGTATPAPECEPIEAPSSSCAVSDVANTTVRLTASNGAGDSATIERSIVQDTNAPNVPSITFGPAARPTMRWGMFDEPLSRLGIDVAEDPSGVWHVANEELDPTEETFVDSSWPPGEPRSYRLNATDRAGHTSLGPWYRLPAEAVPVHASLDADATSGAAIHAALRDGGTVVAVAFDRAMAEVPRLVLESSGPAPFHIAVSGSLDAEARIATYVIDDVAALPSEGAATWRFAGGKGADDAPVADLDQIVFWDAEPPSVHVQGAPTGWLRSARTTVTVEAIDGSGTGRIVVDERSDGVTVSGPSHSKRVTARGEGLFDVAGRAVDAKGNEVAFLLSVGLDARAPSVERDAAEASSVWEASTPLALTIADGTSGVNRSSLQVWVRNATTVVAATVLSWDQEGVVSVVPAVDADDGNPLSLSGPFEVHASVSDAAGNKAEGRVGPPLRVAARAGDDLAEAASTRQLGHNGSAQPAPAPAATGPSWAGSGQGQAGPGSGQEDAGANEGSMLWDPDAWNATVASDHSGPVDDGGRTGSEAGLWTWLGLGGALGLGGVARVVHGKRAAVHTKSPGDKDQETIVGKR